MPKVNFTTSAKKTWDWMVVLDNDRVLVEHQFNSGYNNHYRITVKHPFTIDGHWERHYIREADVGRLYQRVALEKICEIMTR